MKKNIFDTSIFTAAFVGIIVLLNILALNTFFRIDLTRDNQFTLSEASREAVRGLEDRLTIKAYFSDGLPAPYSSNARYIKDLLDEYYAASKGELSYEFLDPMSEETAEDKEKRKETKRDIFGRNLRQETDVEQELRALGIQPVEVRINEGDNLEVKRVYMGISLRYGDEREAIPVVTNTSSLEYDLTTLIRKITRMKVPKVALITGREGLDLQQELGTVMGLLSQQYEVAPVDLETQPEIADDVDAIIVTGPKAPFTETEVAAIDAFVKRGGAAAFFPDAMRVDLRTTSYEEADHGLGALLESYGVRVNSGLLLDAECAQINVTQQRGFMRIAQPVNYPFLPTVKQLDQDHPLTRGLADVFFPFTSALSVVAPVDGAIEAAVLVSSSANSWIQELPLDLNPMQEWPASIDFTGPYPLVVALAGAFGGQDEGRVLVFGGSSVLSDQYQSASGQALVLNLVDWLLLDDAMLEIRSRGMADAPLEEIDDTKRNTIKFANILGVPLLFIAIGIVRWRLRERSRSQMAV